MMEEEKKGKSNWCSWVALACGLACVGVLLVLFFTQVVFLVSRASMLIFPAVPMLAVASVPFGVAALVRREPRRWWGVVGALCGVGFLVLMYMLAVPLAAFG
jgi:4-amino-4-deoxy-L-arabinose transferase-like glycosyltransferase